MSFVVERKWQAGHGSGVCGVRPRNNVACHSSGGMIQKQAVPDTGVVEAWVSEGIEFLPENRALHDT